MSFEYNGVVYRDLEPQVRYDAEQVQLLKQADVTINENLQTVNENLQTINTEINGKLTKPTNPSAESAVTMLADGTVGTKLLSEIGGGKLYLHKVRVSFSYSSSQDGTLVLDNIYNTSNTKLTTEALLSPYMDRFVGIGCVSDFQIGGTSAGSPSSTGGIIFYSDTSAVIFLFGDLSLNSTVTMITGEYTIKSINDTVIEL